MRRRRSSAHARVVSLPYAQNRIKTRALAEAGATPELGGRASPKAPAELLTLREGWIERFGAVRAAAGCGVHGQPRAGPSRLDALVRFFHARMVR